MDDDEFLEAYGRAQLRNFSYPFIAEAVREIDLQDTDPEMPVIVRNRLFDNVIQLMSWSGWSSPHGKRRLPEHSGKFWYAVTSTRKASFKWNGKAYRRRPPDEPLKPMPDGPIYFRDGRRHPSDPPTLIWVNTDTP